MFAIAVVGYGGCRYFFLHVLDFVFPYIAFGRISNIISRLIPLQEIQNKGEAAWMTVMAIHLLDYSLFDIRA